METTTAEKSDQPATVDFTGFLRRSSSTPLGKFGGSMSSRSLLFDVSFSVPLVSVGKKSPKLSLGGSLLSVLAKNRFRRPLKSRRQATKSSDL